LGYGFKAYFVSLLLGSTTPHALLVDKCHFGDYGAHMLRHIVGSKGFVPSFHGDGCVLLTFHMLRPCIMDPLA
jgi:hypothetical protein